MTDNGKRNGQPIANGRKNAVRTREILRLAGFGFLILGSLLAVQTVWLDDIYLFGIHWGSPALGMCFVMALGYRADREVGGVAGLVCGLMQDAASGSPALVRPLLYCLLGWFAGVLGERLLAHNLPSFAVFVTVGALADATLKAAYTVLSVRAIPPLDWIARTCFPPIILTVLFSPAVYCLVKWLLVSVYKE